MTDRETIIAMLAALGKPYQPAPPPAGPRNLLLIGRGSNTFDRVLGADGKALQGPL